MPTPPTVNKVSSGGSMKDFVPAPQVSLRSAGRTMSHGRIITAPQLAGQIEGVAIARIGEIVPSTKEHQVFLVSEGTESLLKPIGWDHYRER